jgi:hypothetical protein
VQPGAEGRGHQGDDRNLTACYVKGFDQLQQMLITPMTGRTGEKK